MLAARPQRQLVLSLAPGMYSNTTSMHLQVQHYYHALTGLCRRALQLTLATGRCTAAASRSGSWQPLPPLWEHQETVAAPLWCIFSKYRYLSSILPTLHHGAIQAVQTPLCQDSYRRQQEQVRQVGLAEEGNAHQASRSRAPQHSPLTCNQHRHTQPTCQLCYLPAAYATLQQLVQKFAASGASLMGEQAKRDRVHGQLTF